jgi:hypothetical protein
MPFVCSVSREPYCFSSVFKLFIIIIIITGNYYSPLKRVGRPKRICNEPIESGIQVQNVHRYSNPEIQTPQQLGGAITKDNAFWPITTKLLVPHSKTSHHFVYWMILQNKGNWHTLRFPASFRATWLQRLNLSCLTPPTFFMQSAQNSTYNSVMDK